MTALAGLSTQKIQYLLAHRPGFVSPTLAARKFATLEHLLGGRLAVHIISGGNDAEQRRTAITSITTSAMPAPTPSLTSYARCGPVSSR